MAILIGTQGWNYAAWVGPFYPPGTRASEFLPTYTRAFRVVEVDSTFYAIPDARAVRAWAERTPPDFTFALKMPKEVTHERRLRNADDVVREFLDLARELGPKLGPILLQMGPDFAPEELPAVEEFVTSLPRDLRFALELRQSRWMRSDVSSAPAATPMTSPSAAAPPCGSPISRHCGRAPASKSTISCLTP